MNVVVIRVNNLHQRQLLTNLHCIKTSYCLRGKISDYLLRRFEGTMMKNYDDNARN